MVSFLVTGGCGFIGSHLVEALIARGDRVRILDDLSTGRRENARAAELVVGDVGDAAQVRRAMEGMDGCFHLAAIASVQRSVEDWLSTHRVNLGGTINVFEAAHATGARRVVYASSAAVYGDNTGLPLAEDAPLRPLTPYGADKAGSELHARAAAAVHGVSSFGLRFFNVFGPRQDPLSPYSGVISIFAEKLLAGRPLTVFGDGRQTRDFVYVGDVVRALLAAMDRRPAGSGALAAGVSNVCRGGGVDLLELIAALEAVTGRNAAVEYKPARVGDIRASIGDTRRLAAELGIVAEVGLHEGLAALVAWLEQARSFIAAPAA